MSVWEDLTVCDFLDIIDSWKLVGWGKMGFQAQTCWTDLLAFWGVWNRSRILDFGPDRLFFRFPSEALLMNTHNICFGGIIRNILILFVEKKKCLIGCYDFTNCVLMYVQKWNINAKGHIYNHIKYASELEYNLTCKKSSLGHLFLDSRRTVMVVGSNQETGYNNSNNQGCYMKHMTVGRTYLKKK